jgi:hypothetical protein
MRYWIINFEYHPVKHLKIFCLTHVLRGSISGDFKRIDICLSKHELAACVCLFPDSVMKSAILAIIMK